MSSRAYLFFLGLVILTALYLEANIIIYVLATMLLLEGVSGISLSELTQKIRNVQLESGLLQYAKTPRFDLDAFRMLRLLLGAIVLISYLLVHEYNMDVLWFFPWFVGFAVLGAGISGVCPVYLAIRWLGFK